jgi:uncharacterized protein YfbU (UPF0304 family)
MKFTDEQRLIVMMLADVQKELKINREFDPDFIGKAAAWKHEFAIGWKYGSVFAPEETPEDFRFVVDVLDMFDFLERANQRLQPSERADLDAQVGYATRERWFEGFDGNNEPELRSYVSVAIDDLGMFSHLKRTPHDDYNSHSQREDRYRAMLDVFLKIRPELGDRDLTVDDLASILRAR